MLTEQQITDAFHAKLGRTPNSNQIEIYKNFTQEQLDVVFERNLAIKNDPTFTQRLAENYQAYLAATPEQQAAWVHIEPNT